MSKDQFAHDLALPSLFDTDEPLFLTEEQRSQPAPCMTMAEMLAMDGGGGTAPEGDGH